MRIDRAACDNGICSSARQDLDVDLQEPDVAGRERTATGGRLADEGNTGPELQLRPFGFFIKEKDGKKFVVPATLEDKLKVLRTAFPDSPKDPGSFQTGSCSDVDSLGNCNGVCDSSEGFLCMKINQFEFYGCACVFME